MRELEDFHDTYLKYRAKHEMRLNIERKNQAYKMQIRHYKTISDVKVICNVKTNDEEEMYIRGKTELISYFEGRRYS